MLPKGGNCHCCNNPTYYKGIIPNFFRYWHNWKSNADISKEKTNKWTNPNVCFPSLLNRMASLYNYISFFHLSCNIDSHHFLAVSPLCSLGSSLDRPSSLFALSIRPMHLLSIPPSFSHLLLVPLNSILSFELHLSLSLYSTGFPGQAHLSHYSSSIFKARRGRSRFSEGLLVWLRDMDRDGHCDAGKRHYHPYFNNTSYGVIN